jgi:hypothetical protein
MWSLLHPQQQARPVVRLPWMISGKMSLLLLLLLVVVVTQTLMMV